MPGLKRLKVRCSASADGGVLARLLAGDLGDLAPVSAHLHLYDANFDRFDRDGEERVLRCARSFLAALQALAQPSVRIGRLVFRLPCTRELGTSSGYPWKKLSETGQVFAVDIAKAMCDCVVRWRSAGAVYWDQRLLASTDGLAELDRGSVAFSDAL